MIEFIENGHYYINSKGIIIPSVSTIVDFLFPNTYKDVPISVLNKAATYGTRVHELIQKYNDNEITLDEIETSEQDKNIVSSMRQYSKIKSKYMIYPKSQEIIVDYQERYAGRYDALDFDNVLIDNKTTKEKHYNKWACQIGFYYLALGVKKDVAYICWLPKGKQGEFLMLGGNDPITKEPIPKPWTWEQCLKGLEAYEEHIANE